MNRLIVSSLAFAFAMASSLAVSGEELGPLIKKVAVANDGYAISKAYRELFVAAGIERNSALKRHFDDSVAIQAAWEDVRRTVPKEQGPKVFRPEKDKLVWFVGFLEARSRSKVPKWWTESIHSARANRRDNIYGGEPAKSPYHNAGLKFVNAPIGTTVQQKGKQCTVKVGGASVVLPPELIDFCDDGSLCQHISAAFTKKECYVAIHDNVGYPHVVACVDRKSGKTKWKSEACGCWWGGASGIHIGWVTVIVHEDRVSVFGKSSIGLYAHGFSREKGNTLFRFSSSF